MTLDTKTIVIIFISLFLVTSSVISFRWLSLNELELIQGKESADGSLADLRVLKKKVDTFTTVATSIDNDEQLKKEYYEKRIRYHNEFGREGVEEIDDVIQTIYQPDTFFELEKLLLKHKVSPIKNEKSKIKFVIEGDKRLVKK